MAVNNGSVVTEFILLGFTDNPKLQIILFVLFLFIFLMIISGNFCIILVAVSDNALHSPMYFFLANLSFLDTFHSTAVIPRMLKDFLSSRKSISVTQCVVQMYMSLALGEVECILLAVMAYDRYIAICHPLHYTTIIRRSVCIRIATGTWICGFCLTIPNVVAVWRVDLCGHNELNHFECEIPEFVSIACGDTTVIELLNFTIGTALLILPVTFIIATYVRIIRSVLRIASSEGRKKAFSTCTSHLIVITMYYGLPMYTYLTPRNLTDGSTIKIYTLFYSSLSPLFNPIIYTLRNNEIKSALRRVIKKVTHKGFS